MVSIDDSLRAHLMYSPASLLPWLPTALEPGPRLSRNSLLGLPPFFPRLFSPLAWKCNAIMRNISQFTHLPSAPAVPKYFPPDECWHCEARHIWGAGVKRCTKKFQWVPTFRQQPKFFPAFLPGQPLGSPPVAPGRSPILLLGPPVGRLGQCRLANVDGEENVKTD